MGSGKSDNDSVGVENDGGNAKPSPILITTGNNPQSQDPNSQSSPKYFLTQLLKNRQDKLRFQLCHSLIDFLWFRLNFNLNLVEIGLV